MQLVYFRGFSECRASKFVSGGQGLADADEPDRRARRRRRRSRKVLAHARDEAKRAKVGALVFVGDAMEESLDALAGGRRRTGDRRRQGLHVPGGRRPAARGAFHEIARLTGGAYGAFDAGAAQRLEALLRAAAAYAAGGRAGCSRRRR